MPADDTHAAASPFIAWLRQRIGERGIGNNQLATYLGVSNGTVSFWLRGRNTPDPRNCLKLAEYFGRSADEVLAIAGHRPTGERELADLALRARLDAVERQLMEAVSALQGIRAELRRR